MHQHIVNVYRLFCEKSLELYSCAGICCSTSRQALIFSRRHTQHSCSAPPAGVSAAHTTHLTGALPRSVASERFAFSRISGEITGSGLTCSLRLMVCNYANSTMSNTSRRDNPVVSDRYSYLQGFGAASRL